MVTPRDLQDDYEEILRSGELDKPQKKKKLNPLLWIVIWFVVFILASWSIAWLY